MISNQLKQRREAEKMVTMGAPALAGQKRPDRGRVRLHWERFVSDGMREQLTYVGNVAARELTGG